MDFNLFLPIAGFAVGLIVGVTGVGGGSLMTPALILLMGVSPVVAVGTDLIFAGITKSVGVWKHRGAGNIDWWTVRMLASGSLPAAGVSVLLLKLLPSGAFLDAAVLPVLGGALLVTALALIMRTQVMGLAGRLAAGKSEPAPRWIVLSGVVLGCLVTLSSVGAGALGVTVLMICRPRMSAKVIVGTGLAHAWPLAWLAGVGHWSLGTVELELLVALLIGSLPGIYLGSSLTGRVPEPVLRGMLAAVMLTAGITCFLTI